ncbi:MAG: hypothetical protein IT352_17510 [Gemmatimonadales bacterium]|nr:hypothetical protein [Gemmatimonadales bacterium]
MAITSFLAGGALAASGLVLTPPRGSDALTLCYPLLRAVTRFDPSLADSVRRRVDAHEAVHRADCDRLGSIRHYLAIANRDGRLAVEARAGCAEARLQIGAGAHPYLEVERMVDELHYGYGWFRELDEGSIREALGRACPDLVALGRVPPWGRR